MTVWFDAMPESIRAEIAESGLTFKEVENAQEGLDAAHIFVTEEAELKAQLAKLRKLIAADGQVWVSWPKKASGVATEIDQAMVQSAGLAAGFVDIKKCAIDETWSGLKFVIPKADR